MNWRSDEFLRRTGAGQSSISFESKARNNLSSGLRLVRNSEHEEVMGFLQSLLRDIQHYGSLPDYTLRRIALHEALEDSPESTQKFFAEIRKLRSEMGDDYLSRIDITRNRAPSEIIIAVENQG